jgi:hypothetical protein
MKAIIEFNLPEDGSEYKIFSSAQAMHSVLWDLQQFLRDKLRYGSKSKSVNDTVEKINTEFHKLLDEEKIELL